MKVEPADDIDDDYFWDVIYKSRIRGLFISIIIKLNIP